MKHKFVVFEGVDGVGKTTLAKALTEATTGHYYYTPPESMKDEAMKYLRKPYTLEQLHFFQRGNKIASDKIKVLLETSNVYLDRYFQSTQAYFEVKLDINIPSQRNILMPDTVIYLTARLPVLEERLASRENRLAHEKVDFLVKVAQRYDLILAQGMQVIRIDTSSQRVNETVNTLRDLLKI